MFTLKDPLNTIERITNALNVIATCEKSARERYIYALNTLRPLQRPGDFNRLEDFTLLNKIVDGYDVNTMNDEQYKQAFNEIWELYWNMTTNTVYR